MCLYYRRYYFFKNLFANERRDFDIYIEFEVIVVLFKPHDYILNTIRLIPCSINETFSSHICISFYLPIPTGQFLLVGLLFPGHVLLPLYPVQMYHFFSQMGLILSISHFTTSLLCKCLSFDSFMDRLYFMMRWLIHDNWQINNPMFEMPLYLIRAHQPACVSGYGLISELVEIRHKLDLFSSSRLHIPQDFWICETLCVLTLYLRLSTKLGVCRFLQNFLGKLSYNGAVENSKGDFIFSSTRCIFFPKYWQIFFFSAIEFTFFL